MFLLPCIYVLSFLIAVYRLFQNKPQYILLFIVLGLPIYITSLSLTYQYGFGNLIPLFQAFKELIVLGTLGMLLYHRKEKLQFHLVDKLVLAFFLYTTLYVFLPLGNFGFSDKLLALKSLSFFPLIYFIGRLIDPLKVNLNRYFHYICIIAILAGIVLLSEVINDQHLQASTGYAAFMEHFFGMEPGGHFGISWTFETGNGLKRFASFFGGPLELGVNTLFTVAVIAALSTKDDNSIVTDRFRMLTLGVSLFSIFFALSRASMASYFILIYVYAYTTKKRLWLKVFHYSLFSFALAIAFVMSGDIHELIITTINFSDSSSTYHVLEWLDGLQAMFSNPFGMGLGMSGRISNALGANIGGENQLIIIGVQTGFVAVLLYAAIYASTIRLCIRQFNTTIGKARKLALTLLLVKVGLIIPTFTANVESYVYIAYLTWFCTGLVVNMSCYNRSNLSLSNAE